MPQDAPRLRLPHRHRPSATGRRIAMRGMTGFEAAEIATEIAIAIVMCAEMRRATDKGIRVAMGVRAPTIAATIAAIWARAARAVGRRSAIQAASATRQPARISRHLAEIQRPGRIKRRARIKHHARIKRRVRIKPLAQTSRAATKASDSPVNAASAAGGVVVDVVVVGAMAAKTP
jgi:hypothetical protein